jgi:acid phosphatase (class A)
MGSGWFGSGWFGSGWFGSGWLGSGWSSSGGGGGANVFPLRPDFIAVPTPHDLAMREFPPGAWDVDLYSLKILPEFFSLNWKTTQPAVDWRNFTNAQIDQEIQLLLNRGAADRPKRIEEIVRQDQNFQEYWLQLLMVTPHSHPATFKVMKLAARVGEVLMMHWKPFYNRPRPSQICPTLLPPIPVAGHASYPSGHSLISHLTSLCLADVIPGKAAALDALARRIADNREIAGLHYPSDTQAGEDVAKKAHPLLKQGCPTYQFWFGLAQNEVVSTPPQFPHQ